MKALADLAIEDPNAPVEVIISSPGGEVDSGMAIYDALKGLLGKSPRYVLDRLILWQPLSLQREKNDLSWGTLG